MPLPYLFRWAMSPANRKGDRCRIVDELDGRTALVEFGDGARFKVSRYALRRAA